MNISVSILICGFMASAAFAGDSSQSSAEMNENHHCDRHNCYFFFRCIYLATDAEEKAANAPANEPETPASPKDNSLEFLADVPSLSAVSVRMTEAAFFDIVKQQKLSFERKATDDETAYYVHPKEGVLVYFGFRQSRCTGIQRLRD